MSAVAGDVQDRLAAEGVIAVIRAGGAREAVVAARALAAGGVRAVEIAFTTPGAPEAIAELSGEPELLVGAGTVRSAAHAADAIEAGARFLVSPALVEPALELAEQAGVLALPGALTPTEVLAAAERAPVVKLFPASIGGPAYLRALLAPAPELLLVPTGGVSAANAGEWLAAGAFALGAGSELCPSAAIAAGDTDALTASARRYRAALDAATVERAPA